MACFLLLFEFLSKLTVPTDVEEASQTRRKRARGVMA